MNELERALVALGRELDVPEAPDLAAAVLARLERRDRAEPARRRWVARGRDRRCSRRSRRRSRSPTRAPPSSACCTSAASEIELVDELPEVAPGPAELDLELTLGDRVSLEEARERAGFDLRELEEAPDRVYLGDRGTVWFLYGTPESVRLLVAQTPRPRVDEELHPEEARRPGTERRAGARRRRARVSS